MRESGGGEGAGSYDLFWGLMGEECGGKMGNLLNGVVKE